ncbi:MAG: 5-(carboxyamino)imidazole ribonucleotide mutase, partial [Thermoflexus sp.]
SSLRMPGGIAPAVVLEPTGAALLAAKMLGLADPAVRERVAAFQAQQRERLRRDDQEIQEQVTATARGA